MSTKKREKWFLSKEELKDLEPYIYNGQPIRGKEFLAICKKYGRKSDTLRGYIYTVRYRNKKSNMTNKEVKNITNDSVVTASKGEFKIPMKDWTIKNENGNFYFIVKF